MKGVTVEKKLIAPLLPVSIHTPNEGSDHRSHSRASVRSGFQSTLPMKGVTNGRSRVGLAEDVSIHTPNEGSDVFVLSQ